MAVTKDPVFEDVWETVDDRSEDSQTNETVLRRQEGPELISARKAAAMG